MKDKARSVGSRRVVNTGILMSGVAIAACGGAGPGVGGPEAEALFATYSAVWVLDSIDSDPVPGLNGRDAVMGRGGDPFGGGAPGRRGGPAFPGAIGGGGRGGAGGQGPGGLQNPALLEALQATLEAGAVRPDRITLSLTDSLFEVAQSPGGRAVMPMSGEEVEIGRSRWPTRVRVRWDDRRPRVERSLEDGGKVVDRYEAIRPDRLVLRRTVEGLPRGDLEMRFVYDRAEGR